MSLRRGWLLSQSRIDLAIVAGMVIIDCYLYKLWRNLQEKETMGEAEQNVVGDKENTEVHYQMDDKLLCIGFEGVLDKDCMCYEMM
ncbi:hypothetical protein QQP08_021609 [Theobroma cacao]|nr:hypothetical protein QQP08_021609 [Theobroma cacao]